MKDTRTELQKLQDTIKSLEAMNAAMLRDLRTGQEHKTLRDQFAMAALTALVHGNSDYAEKYYAQVAYMYADDMLLERKA